MYSFGLFISVLLCACLELRRTIFDDNSAFTLVYHFLLFWQCV